MICPRCASNQNDEIKFCTSCGANLQAVRDALEAPDTKFDWGNTWVAEMFMSGQAAEMRKREMERRLGITPEIKRYNEVKAGVIVSSIGIALAIFLFIFMQGIAGKVEPGTVDIITRLWVVGIIPFMIGIALMINGFVVSKKIVEAWERDQERDQKTPKALDEEPAPRPLRAADTSGFVPANMSVTDQTTRHLENAERKIR